MGNRCQSVITFIEPDPAVTAFGLWGAARAEIEAAENLSEDIASRFHEAEMELASAVPTTLSGAIAKLRMVLDRAPDETEARAVAAVIEGLERMMV